MALTELDARQPRARKSRRQRHGVAVARIPGYHLRRVSDDLWRWCVLAPNGRREQGESESERDARADARQVLLNITRSRRR